MSQLLSQCERMASDKALINRFASVKGFDQIDYMNLMFETDDPKLLWKLLYEQLYLASAFGRCLQESSMAMCQGRHGWDDYLLLHHYDAGVKCDPFPEEL